MTALLLKSVLNELMEQAGLPGSCRANHQKFKQIIIWIIHSTLKYIQGLLVDHTKSVSRSMTELNSSVKWISKEKYNATQSNC
jgi:hypothetical protein